MTTVALGSAPVIRRYLRHLRTRRLSDETLRHAECVLNGLALRIVHGGDLLTLDGDALVEWQESRLDELAPRSLAAYTSTVRGFYRWAVQDGLLDADPTARLVSPKLPRLLPRPIPEDRLKHALDCADDVMRVVLCLAAFAGLRACEIAGLDWTNVFFGGEPYVRVIGKGQKERTVDMSDEVVDALVSLPHRRGVVIRRLDGKPGRMAANTLDKRANRFLHDNGVTETLHQLRHRCGTEVAREGGIQQAAEVLGHEHLSTTAGYAQVARRDLRDTIRKTGRLRLEDEASSGPSTAVGRPKRPTRPA